MTIAVLTNLVNQINAKAAAPSHPLKGGVFQVGNHHLIWVANEGVMVHKIETPEGQVSFPFGNKPTSGAELTAILEAAVR